MKFLQINNSGLQLIGMRWYKKALILLAALVVSIAPSLYFPQVALAARLENRSIDLGSSQANAVTNHTFSFTVPTAGNIGSIAFEYCSNTPIFELSCTAPTGLDASLASIDSQSGITGFSVHGLTDTNRLVITRTPAANPAGQAAVYDFGNIVNPTDANVPTYIRITTYPSDDGTGPETDRGAVVFVITPDFTVEAFVPPFLTFCAAITVASNCTSTSGNFINLGELSRTSANFSTSQFAGATNDPGGYSTYLAGSTMSSGINTIPPLTSPSSSNPGTSQYGMNLVANSNPDVGQNRTGGGTATPATGFGNPNQFLFQEGIIASTANSTNFNVFTVSYLVNVSNNQKPGIYTTTMTYIATAAF